MKITHLFSFMALLVIQFISSCESNKEQTKELITIDVRTADEWLHDGHADCSINIPLDELSEHVEEIKAYEKVVVVCRSGNRAAAAKQLLEQHGVKAVENKGAWQQVTCL